MLQVKASINSVLAFHILFLMNQIDLQCEKNAHCFFLLALFVNYNTNIITVYGTNVNNWNCVLLQYKITKINALH